MFKLLLSSIFTVVMVAGLTSVSMAGHSYHGYSMQMSEMSEMDSNDDGTITFDEFSAPTVDRLKSGFDMLDTDNNEKIAVRMLIHSHQLTRKIAVDISGRLQ